VVAASVTSSRKLRADLDLAVVVGGARRRAGGQRGQSLGDRAMSAVAVDEDADEDAEHDGPGRHRVEGGVRPTRDHVVEGGEQHGFILADAAGEHWLATVALPRT
jgi:hypothetical protein